MNYSYTILLLISFTINLVNAQQKAFDLTVFNELKDHNRAVTDVFTVSDSDTENLSVFIEDKKTLNAYVYNKDFEKVNQLISEGLPKKYNSIIGYIQNNDETILFLKNSTSQNFGAIIFNFKTGNTSEMEFDFKLKNGEYVESLSKNGKFYLLSTDKKKSIINCFEFNGLDYQEHQIKLNQDFRIADNKQKNLYEMLKNLKKSSPDPLEIRKINTDLPVSIELAGAMNKIYETDKGFELTLDKSIYETYLINVNLNNYTAEIERFEKPHFSVKDRFFSKSFLLDENIYHVVGNKQELFFEARNRSTRKLLKKLHVNKDEDIPFKNSPIVQDTHGGILAPHKKLKKTSKFLRKIDNEDISVAVQKKNNNYIVTIGSFSKPYHGSTVVMMAPAGGMGMGASTIMAVPLAYNFNPSLSSYLSYTYGKSVRIKCLFDNNFNHIEGEVLPNLFDRITNYAKLLDDPIAENVFEWNNSIYYGFYSANNEAYRMINFSK